MWGAIISGVLGLAKLGYGAYQKGQAKKDAKNNTFTPYQISSLYGDTLGVAQQEANFGFTPETLNAFTQTSQQNLAAGSEAILRGGGDVNDINKLYGIDTTARKNMSFENDKLRATKLQNYFDQSAQMAGQQAIAWRLNYFDRWKDKAVASTMLLQNANNNISGGISTLGNAAGQFANIASAKKVPSGSNDSSGIFAIPDNSGGAGGAGSGYAGGGIFSGGAGGSGGTMSAGGAGGGNNAFVNIFDNNNLFNQYFPDSK